MTANSVSLDRPVSVEGDLRLPRPPGVVRRFWGRHPRLTDSLVAVAYFGPAVLFCLVLGSVPDPLVEPPAVITGIAVLGVGAGALVFRRRRPWLVVWVAWAATLVAAPLIGVVDVALIPFAVYALAIYGSVRAAWLAFAGSVVVGAVAGALAGPLMRTDPSPSLTVAGSSTQFAITLLVVVLVATNIGNRRRYVAALVDRAATLVREREQLARLAAIEERSRIARDMHDIVSHSLTVMVTLAEGSAAIAPDEPARAAGGMQLVAETGRSALTDMRRMLGVLNASADGERAIAAAALEPQPGVADLEPLVGRFRSAGLRVRFSSRGRAPADPSEQLAIYRIVQESLTNTLRHAIAPTVVEVDLRYRRRSVSITVTDDGRDAVTTAGSAGHGLIGMRERVALYSGTFDSGALPTGGWRTAATLRHDREAE